MGSTPHRRLASLLTIPPMQSPRPQRQPHYRNTRCYGPFFGQWIQRSWNYTTESLLTCVVYALRVGLGQPRSLPIHLLASETLFVDVSLSFFDKGRPLTGMGLMRCHIVDP